MKIKKKIIEKIDIKSPMNERDAVLDYLYNNNYSIISQGPLIESFPKINLEIFHAIAEKEIK